jgi:uncharacterized protein YcfL
MRKITILFSILLLILLVGCRAQIPVAQDSIALVQNTIQNAPSASPSQEADSELAPGQIAVDASVIVDFELMSTSP